MIAKKGKTNYNKTMKVKKTTKPRTKKKTTKSEEPWVKVLDMNVNPNNPRNGFFELDWNDEFVNNLKQHGYQGNSDEEIVEEDGKTTTRKKKNPKLKGYSDEFKEGGFAQESFEEAQKKKKKKKTQA